MIPEHFHLSFLWILIVAALLLAYGKLRSKQKRLNRKHNEARQRRMSQLKSPNDQSK